MSADHQGRSQNTGHARDPHQEQGEPRPDGTRAHAHSGSVENLPGFERFEPVGHTVADRALADLADLAHRPVADHASLYQRAHDQLTHALEAPVNAIQVSGE